MTRALPFLALSLLATAACSSTPSSGDGSTPITNIPTPPANVSFSKDVVPIFQMSCGTSNAICHGATTVADPSATQPRPFLGAPFGTPDTATLATIHDGIVNVPSNEDAKMNYVTPGQTDQSYLWFKVTAQQDQLTANCTNPAFSGCGLAMPFQATPLTGTQLSIIEGWIQQGASNN